MSMLVPRLGLTDCSIILTICWPDISAESKLFAKTAMSKVELPRDGVTDKGSDVIVIGAPFLYPWMDKITIISYNYYIYIKTISYLIEKSNMIT